ncbi:MAG TPA: FG-GAP-like repeat-containing protein [Thermoguttaceae bacterium]|nr:FG-GAP-like repeat-containing protein [Thermoguttaceae bacterium]
MKCRPILCAMGLMCLTASWPSSAPAKETKVILLAGTKSHAPGEHEYEEGMNLFRHCLDTSLNVKGVIVEVHTNGWPQDEKTLDDADTIVLFGDGGSRSNRHPLAAGNHMAALERQMQRGCGLAVIHWSLNLPSKIGRETFLPWIGGFKDYENPPRPIGEPLRVDDWSKQAAHPICRGLKPFEMPKDEYKTPERLLSDEPGFVPILPFPGKPGAPLWAWAWQRADGGRGFGFIGGHNHRLWEIEDLRKAVLNAILWTAHKPVPTDGAISSLPAPMTTPPVPVFIPVKIDGPVHDPAIGSYWYGPFNESCSLADVDGDGRLDVTCGVHWYEAPRWTKHPYYFEGAEQRNFLHGHCHEAALDVNRDGFCDVANSGYQPDVAGLLWYENPGPRGGKWKVHRAHQSPYIEGVVPADLNGDGHPDLLLNHFRKYGGVEGEGSVARVEAIVWLESIDKEPWLVKHVIADDADDHGAAVADLNGDGRVDVLSKHGWYEAPPDPAEDHWPFHQDYEIPFRASLPMVVTDVNGDGLGDIIAGNGHGYGLYWYEQRIDRQGKRTFQRHPIEEHYGNFHTMVLVDLNGDGKPDLLTGKRLFGHDGRDESEWDPLFLFWYDLQGGKFERHVISFNNLQYYPGRENVNEPPQYACGTGMKITPGDVNGDGKLDVVVAGRGGLYAFINRGLTPIPKAANPKVPMIGEKRPDLNGTFPPTGSE